jgi:hypothetical protein
METDGDKGEKEIDRVTQEETNRGKIEKKEKTERDS